MTDTRATERLLEVIEELRNDAVSAYWQEESPLPMLNEIDTVITELRRRGDTLVRRDDLVRLYDGYGDDCPTGGIEMLKRIQNVIGGKP